jgi:Cft2 family RNA processing exonuclease
MRLSAEAIIETVRRDGNVLLPVDTAARVLEILLWLNEVGRACIIAPASHRMSIFY